MFILSYSASNLERQCIHFLLRFYAHYSDVASIFSSKLLSIYKNYSNLDYYYSMRFSFKKKFHFISTRENFQNLLYKLLLIFLLNKISFYFLFLSISGKINDSRRHILNVNFMQIYKSLGVGDPLFRYL